MLRSIAIALGVAFILFPSHPAAAQQVCGKRAEFLIKLDKSYAEHPVSMGLTDKGAVIEVFASSAGSWTFLITLADGMTCMVASGQNWEHFVVTESKPIS